MSDPERTEPAAAEDFKSRLSRFGGRWGTRVALGLAGLVAAGLLGVLIALAAVWPNLPSIAAVTDYQPKIPLRVYSADGALLGEFGEERRSFIRIQDTPEHLKKAILAIEDDRFYEHGGIDFMGVARAALSNLLGGAKQGASTITQQVARNFFLSSEQTYKRKVYEALLSLKIESALTKDQILELYINQIFLGQRAYGFAAAAKTYFGKDIRELSVAEAAMLAGIPKFPSSANPVANFKRATQRQQYILDRMRQLGYIDQAKYEAAKKEQLVIKPSRTYFEAPGDYVAEMARKIIFEQYGDETYTRGINVYTTILKDDQTAAYNALRRGLLDYERRHGFRGPEAFVNLPGDKAKRDEAIESALDDIATTEDLRAGVVLEVKPRELKLQLGDGDVVTVGADGTRFVQAAMAANAPAARAIRPGAVLRLGKDAKGNWEILQLPEVEAAFVSLNPNNGAVRALVGGFDFNRNKFNNVTQARRQPGSSFKPFVYSAALEKGFTPATLINDAPIIIPASVTGSQIWEPKNYDGKFEGPMTMRQALAKSKNMVSIRLMQAVGPQDTQNWITRFGFNAEDHPAYLTMALGAGSTNPWEMAGAYSVFANGGYRINPFFIFKVTDQQGKVLMQAKPRLAGDEANRAIDARNAYTMWSLLQGVVKAGTATKALSLKRGDIAGKTGTTNDARDAWFAGFNNQVVGVGWVGYSDNRSLGERETGGGVALPIWISYMAAVLPKLPEIGTPVPEGLTTIGSEIYYVENIPGQGVSSLGMGDLMTDEQKKKEEAKEQLF